MRVLLAAVLIAVLGLAACSSSDDSPDYSGTWDFLLTLGPSQVPMVVTISVADGDTTGTFTVQGDNGTISGRTDGDRIDWAWLKSSGSCRSARITGLFDSDKHGSGLITAGMNGCSDDGRAYPWTATKR